MTDETSSPTPPEMGFKPGGDIKSLPLWVDRHPDPDTVHERASAAGLVALFDDHGTVLYVDEACTGCREGTQ